MDDAKWERAAGAGGILFVVMILISAVLPGTPPMTGDPPGEIAKWFADNGDEIRLAAMLGLLATIPLVWRAAAVYRMLERATGNHRLGVMLVLGVAIAAVAAGFSSLVYAVVAIAGVEGTGGINGTRFYYLLGTNAIGLAAIGLALAVGAVSAAILRTGMLPKLLGWYGALVALLAVLGSAIAVSTRDALFTLSFVSFLTFALWVLIVSGFMLRGPAPAAVTATATAPPQ